LLLAVMMSGAVAGQSAADVSGERGDRVAAAYREGFAAFRTRDYAAAADTFKRAYEINPGDDATVYFVAAAYALGGDRARAVEWLGKLADLKSCFSPSPATFASIADSAEFKAVKERIAAASPAAHHAALAFTVTEKDLIPEGMAYDAAERVFYLSSLRKRKIVRVTPGVAGRAAAFEDFTTEAQDGLYCVLGMKVDARRRVLWAISSAEPFMRGYTKADDGKAALFAYDLRTRKLIKKFAPPTDGLHLLNDLALDREGNVFATDTRSSEIFKLSRDALARDGGALEVLVAAGTLASPNGIAISDDGRQLFIASIPQGVYRLDLKTGQLARLPYPQGISLVGIDGLYFYKRSLVGVLNMINPGRVARFYLNDALDRVTRAEIVECDNPLFDDPTTGALAEGSLYFIANSQYESAFDESGAILPVEKLHDVFILKAKL
jgi:hypothetical protein